MQTRRTFLKSGLSAGAALGGASAFGPVLDRALAYRPPKHATVGDIEHVVILMQENRSFDHYFGTLRGVRGFADPHAQSLAGRSVFDQLDPDLVANPSGHVLPFRLNDATTSGQCVADQSHAWAAQQGSWDNGHNDHFVAAHRIANGSGAHTGALSMGYYTRDDIPFHYALADAFTICDAYHCSVFGPTNPNRIMSMSGTVDAAAARGGPCLDNGQSHGQLKWISYPERLEAAGISWDVYQETDNDTNNVLPLFSGVNAAPRSSRLAQRANSTIPTPKGAPYGPALVSRLRHDVRTGRLPQVSWILASSGNCEHPSAAPNVGADFIASVLHALTSNLKSWSKTLVFLTYDENDGFFDHVVPPTAPPGTPDEYVSAGLARHHPIATDGFSGPVGLGFRVPMLLISPFTRGGMVCSDVFDHTSMLRFLETRFGVREPNISAWRRGTVGDLVSAIGCLRSPSYAFPRLPATRPLAAAANTECAKLPAPAIPRTQTMPGQEPGSRPLVGSCA
ncbi:MAG: alkaline phosphatase family protein [Solirubrobacteraceae bacterium]